MFGVGGGGLDGAVISDLVWGLTVHRVASALHLKLTILTSGP